jgi:hypothetical protein
MIPLRWEGQTAIFTSHQIEDYGLPEEWGYHQYEVIDDRSTIHFTTDYKLEQSYYKRPIHRYNRLERKSSATCIDDCFMVRQVKF